MRSTHTDTDASTTTYGDHGLTTREVARRYRVGLAKVLNWIKRGELRAINTSTSLCGRPRYVVPVDALAEFERGRAGAVPTKPVRRKRRLQVRDYYPD